MKKLFAIVAIAAVLTACNNSGDDKTPATDTTKMTTVDPTKAADSISKMVDTAKKAMDNMVDTAKKSMDKMVDKAKEATKKN